MPSQMTNFEGLLETAPDALVRVDQDGMIRFVNRQTESLFGYDRDDLVGQPVETLVPESDRAVHRVHRQCYVQDPRARAMGTSLKLRGRRRDGTQSPVDIALSPIDTGDGLFVIAAVRDKTRWEKTQEDRHFSDLLRAIVEHSDDAIIGKTLDGIITSWNPAAERMYGYSRDEVIGKSIDLLSTKDRTGQMHTILAMISAGEPVDHLETIRVRKDGTTITVSLNVSPIRDAHDAIIGASTIVRDMTAQKQAFDAARSMIEASLDSLVAISPEGKITDVNEATVKATGVSRDQLIGTAFSDYFTEPEKANEIYRRVFAQGMAVDYPLTLRHRDGTLTEVLYNASVYRDPVDNVLGVFAAARDVTKLMHAYREITEQPAQELDRLEELERFHRLTVGRELKMIELKKENEYLKRHFTAEQSESDHQR
jgi:PAS domain S-box-containing protein